MKKLLLGLTAALFFLVSCGAKTDNNALAKADSGAKLQKLKIGASPVPHAEILKLVKDDLKKEGVDLEIVEFTDYIQPNIAVGDKSIDANFFQHVPYMENFAKEKHLDLVSVGTVHIEPIAVYSKKIKNVNELKSGDTILIPNDPTNGARALILLDKAGVIKLKDNKNLTATTKDIVSNPKNIKFVELSAEQIAPRLGEVAAAIINNNFALDAKLTLKKDAILVEDKDSPYANVVTVLKGNENDPRIQKLMKALRSSEKVKQYIAEKNLVPAF